ncbi:MAG: ferrous iron transporter B [Clostridia bacterium]|nr:ferrous iron transporter B [Clostridia bacterium]
MKKIILVGNPNTGKTTLYNTLTNSNEKASNYGGVTVDVKNAKLLASKDIYIYDIPGFYSTSSFSPEEKISLKFLKENSDALVVYLCDINNLKRNLFLALQLKEMGVPFCLVINNTGGFKNADELCIKLEKEIDAKCFLIDARKRKKCNKLLNFLQNFDYNTLKMQKYNISTTFKIEEEILNQTEFLYKKIEKILSHCNYKIINYNLNKFDSLLFKPWFAISSFLIIFLTMFFITFGYIGQTCSNFFAGLFSFLCYSIFPFMRNGNGVVVSFFRDGLIASVCSVLSFLPQIIMLHFFISLLEDTGYLSRVAFVFDGFLSKIGLSGRAVFSLLFGFGCTTNAMLTTRNIENGNIRKRTALILPYYTCSAKLPIFALLCSCFFNDNKFLVVILLYLLGFLVSVLISYLTFKLSKEKVNNSFILEMPRLKMPYLPKILRDMLNNALDFIKRIGGVIIIASVVIWFMSRFSVSFEFVEVFSENSIAGGISSLLKPIFSPLGFSSAIILAIIAGLVAKETIISVLMLASGATSVAGLQSIIIAGSGTLNFSVASALAFLVFVLLYPVCISAMAVTKQEFGGWFLIKSLAIQLGVAYFASLIVLLISNGEFLKLICVSLIILIVAVVVSFMIKYNKSNGEKCYGCTKQCSKNCLQKKQ